MYVKNISEGQFVLIHYEGSGSLERKYPALVTYYNNSPSEISVLIEPIVDNFTGNIQTHSIIYNNKKQSNNGIMVPVRYNCAFSMKQYINNGKVIGDLLEDETDSCNHSKRTFEKSCVTVFPDYILANIFEKYRLVLRL